MIHGAEVWILNNDIKIATKVLQRADRNTTEKTERKMGIDKLQYIEEKRLIQYGHVRRDGRK